MALRSRITIYNAALLRTGNKEVIDGDDTFLYRTLEANYDEIVRQAFEEQEYPFGKARKSVTSRSDGRFGYDDAFTMPNDVLHITEVWLDECSSVDLSESWEVDTETNELMVNAGNRSVEIEYLRVGQEARWSASFTKMIQRRLEAVIKDALEEPSEAAALDQEAEYMGMKAGTKASRNRSSNRVRRGGRLVRAHRGGN